MLSTATEDYVWAINRASPAGREKIYFEIMRVMKYNLAHTLYTC